MATTDRNTKGRTGQQREDMERATMRDGVLEVAIPASHRRGRRIEIEDSAGNGDARPERLGGEARGEQGAIGSGRGDGGEAQRRPGQPM